jgi:hypothetical protein
VKETDFGCWQVENGMGIANLACGPEYILEGMKAEEVVWAMRAKKEMEKGLTGNPVE